ncbi:MAG: Sir2 family NAD-dependent protein deacetylase [Draconibacterium sp.]
MEILVQEAADLIKKSDFTIVFTGAGISVESGIPPFRGELGLWNKYDPKVLDIDYYLQNEEKCWYTIREIFYDFFTDAKPNSAHKILAKMETKKLLNSIITQNIDNLHYEAGSKVVHEFHGNSKKLKCLKCGRIYDAKDFDFRNLPPRCTDDNQILKPDFIFFGEGIPPLAYSNSFNDAKKAKVCIIIGSTGEVTPAAYIPVAAKEKGAAIIEINPEESMFTNYTTDIFLQGKAGEVLTELGKLVFK